MMKLLTMFKFTNLGNLLYIMRTFCVIINKKGKPLIL